MSTQKPVSPKGPAPARLPPEDAPEPTPVKPKGPAPITVPLEKPSE